jgi:hypothetical protein
MDRVEGPGDRLDLARATGQPFAIGGHDPHVVEQAVRDLALGWPAASAASFRMMPHTGTARWSPRTPEGAPAPRRVQARGRAGQPAPGLAPVYPSALAAAV